MPGDPRIRAADADRDRAAALLREHHAAGRLTAGEFHDRLEKAIDARTMGELDELMADLPAIDLYQLPDASLRRIPERPSQAQSLIPQDAGKAELTGLSPAATAVVAWATVASALVAIGLVTAVLIGAVAVWAFAGLAAAAIAWIVFLIRRSGR
ncbi:MAG TPA: DUF1707 domain-containing protein [Streptosporangiaceae bacterium]|nr:DUF1707 domain-containing protein [Streptosporangiaceae bacterium]